MQLLSRDIGLFGISSEISVLPFERLERLQYTFILFLQLRGVRPGLGPPANQTKKNKMHCRQGHHGHQQMTVLSVTIVMQTIIHTAMNWGNMIADRILTTEITKTIIRMINMLVPMQMTQETTMHIQREIILTCPLTHFHTINQTIMLPLI